MSKGPKISIITACYNAEKSIEQTIQSVISQTYDNIEYIIVDGASTDGTMDIVRKYKGQIDVIISEADKGVYDAFNKGAKIATGDFIQYLNGDDYLISNDAISKMGNFIRENRDIALIYGGIMFVNEDTGHKYQLNRKFTFEDIQDGKMIPHPATFISRDVLLEMEIFNDKYSIAADYDLICKVYKKYYSRILFYPEMISVFRTGGISSDFKNKEKVSAEVKNILEHHFEEHSYKIQKINNEAFFKKWIEKGIFENKSMGDLLAEKNIKNVTLWGTGELSVMIYKELCNKGINTLFYIDNDKDKHHLEMNNVAIFSPEHLKENYRKIDCIIMSFEGRHEESVRKQIETFNLPIGLPVYSWRDLVMEL